MFARTRYIAWAVAHFGQTSFDLATSGIPLVGAADLGLGGLALDSPSAYAELRDEVARYNDVTAAEVVPALGTSHALYLAYAALAGPGDEILVESPGYEPLTRAAEGVGATVRTFDRRADEGYRVVPERVAAAMGPRTRAIVVSNLHNPTGVRLPDELVAELARVADARGAYVIVDEVYAPFDDLPVDGVFRGSARKIAANVIAIASLTKAYGVGMHRVGWLLGPEEIVARAEDAIVGSCGHLPVSHAAIGVAALARVGALATRARSLFEGKRAIVDAWARAQPGATWSAPAEGLFGLVRLPGCGDLLPAIERTARDTGVLVSAGSFFGVPDGFRRSWASCSPESLRQGLDLLGQAMTTWRAEALTAENAGAARRS